MNTGWVVAFCALALLTLLTAIMLVATMRQVGVLHQRIRPTGAGSYDGPRPGMHLPLLPFTHAGGRPADAPLFASPVTVVAYVTPDCSACKAIPGAAAAFARNAPRHIQTVLAMDAPPDDVAAYAAGLGSKVPVYRCDRLAKAYDIPGSPFVLVVRTGAVDTLEVMGAGVVNTLEQLEVLVDEATTRVDGIAALELQSEAIGRHESTHVAVSVVQAPASNAAHQMQQ